MNEFKNSCSFCKIPMIFSGFEKDLDVNEFNHFLVSDHSKLIEHLIEIFRLDKSAVSCFLSQEFEYSGRD